MIKKGYTTVNLPTSLVEELKVWRLAFNASYGRTISYAEMFRSMLDSLKDTEPGVFEEMERLLEKHPELMDKFGNTVEEA